MKMKMERLCHPIDLDLFRGRLTALEISTLWIYSQLECLCPILRFLLDRLSHRLLFIGMRLS